MCSRIALLILIALSGCARFSTTQTDISYDDPESEMPTRTITTKVSVSTFFSAKSELAKLKVLQTEKTQSTGVGALGQESTETNLFNALGAGIGTALKVYTGKPL